jgi:hypothetical protein
MTTNAVPPLTSTNNSLFATLAAIESGTGGGYSLNQKGVLGAYSMGYSALSAIGAVTGGIPGQPSTYVWNPDAGFGSSTAEFLSNPSLQNAAALQYMNRVVIPTMPASVVSGTQTVNGVPVTVDGYLLAGWEQPNNALGVTDLSNRLQGGALAQAEAGFPFPIGLPVATNGSGLPPGTTASLSNNNNTLTVTAPSGAQIVYSADPTSGAGTITIGGASLAVNAATVQSIVGVNGFGQPILQIGTSFDGNGNILSVAQISATSSGGTGVLIQNGPSSQDPDTITVKAGANAQISLINPEDGDGTSNAITVTIPGQSGGALFKLSVDDIGVSITGAGGASIYSSTGTDSVSVSAGQINIDGGSNPAGIGSTRGEVITSAGTQVFDGTGNLIKTIPSNVNVQEDENGFLSYPDPTDGTKTDLISPTGTLGSKTAMLLDDEGNPVGSLANLANVESIAGVLPNGPGQGGEGDNGLYDALKVASNGDDGSPTDVTAWQNAAGETTSLSFTSSTTGAVYQLSYNPQSASGAAVKVSPADSNGVQTLSSWSVDDNGAVTAGPSIQINGTIDTSNLQAGQPVAVSTPAGTYHIDPATGDITDSGAVTATIGGETVTLIGLGGSSPFSLILNDNSVSTAGAVSSNVSVFPLTANSAAGSYSDPNGNSYFVQSSQITTAVVSNGNGGWTITSLLPANTGNADNSWTIAGVSGQVTIGDGGIISIPTQSGNLAFNTVTGTLDASNAGASFSGVNTGGITITGSGSSPQLSVVGLNGDTLAACRTDVSHQRPAT